MVSREHLWITPRLRVGRPLAHPWQVVSQRDLHPAWALGCWGRVALLVVPDRRRHTSYLPGVSVVLLPMQSPKGFVGLRRTRAITRRWMQCASTREVCHRVNPYGFDVIVLLPFLRCTFQLLVAHWFTDGHAVAAIALYLYFFPLCFLPFSTIRLAQWTR